MEKKNPGLGFALLILLIDAIIICYGVIPESIIFPGLDSIPRLNLGLFRIPGFELGWFSIPSFELGGLEQGAQIPLLLACIVSAASGVFFLNIKWRDIEEGMYKAISVALQAIIILMIVGSLVGSWMQSGVAPTLIYYGLELLTPQYFLLAALFICAIVSLSTGSSWSTSGTVGIALMGVGAGLNIPAHITAGFIISGAYFGDKMSPLSDTTNLAPAVAGSELFSHIRAMCWTTLPVLAIVAGLAVYYGSNASGDMDSSKIILIQQMMKSEFTISWVCFIPPILVLASAIMKVPAIPGIVLGILSAVAISAFNGTGAGSILGVLFEGYTPGFISEVGSAEMGSVLELIKGTLLENSNSTPEQVIEIGGMLTKLFSRGGMNGMMETIALILMALSLGGILETCGYLEVIINKLLESVRSVTGLVTSVIVSCIFSNIFLADQYLAIVIPGRMFKGAFDKSEFKGKKMAPAMLSRTLEDSGTLTSVLVPWNTCGAYNAGILGVSTFAYMPYAFLNYLVPVAAVVITWLGIGIKWRGKEEQ
ncbi:MAG: Na+/H+ antiporter NhaC [Synergistaceae bacterium]|nr:Na+/H+ antiporter NhaC [Synergistaceae bacterium]